MAFSLQKGMSDYRFTRLSDLNFMNAKSLSQVGGTDSDWWSMARLLEIYRDKHGGDCAVTASFDQTLHDWVLAQGKLVSLPNQNLKNQEERRMRYLRLIGMDTPLRRMRIVVAQKHWHVTLRIPRKRFIDLRAIMRF